MGAFTSIAAIAGGALAAGGSIAGAAISSSAADDATNAQVNAQREGMRTQERLAREGMSYQERQAQRSEQLLRDFFGQSQAQLKPFQDAQLQALGQAQGLTDANNPFYQQQREQMTQAIQRQLAAQGLLRSKNQVDLLGNMELGLNQQRINQINSLANLGAVQQGAANMQALGGGLANIAGNLGANVGQAFGSLGSANAQGLKAIGQSYAANTMANAQNTSGLMQSLAGIGSNTFSSIANYKQGQAQQQQQADQFAQMLAILGRR